MKLLKFAAFLLHRYYSTGRWASGIPYFRTMAVLTFLGYIHLMQILIVSSKIELLPFFFARNKMLAKVGILLTLAPIYFTLTRFVTKEDIEKPEDKYRYDWEAVFNGNVWLIVYIILTFSLLMVLILNK